jgi:hypothetical protein
MKFLCSLLLLLSFSLIGSASAWTTPNRQSTVRSSSSVTSSSSLAATTTTTTAWFASPAVANKEGEEDGTNKPAAPPLTLSVPQIKAQILQLGAVLDRGQAYNPTSGSYYEETMNVARSKVVDLLEAEPDKIPSSLEEFAGEWELVLSTVPHGIFRSSPFFLAIQESYEYAESKGA